MSSDHEEEALAKIRITSEKCLSGTTLLSMVSLSCVPSLGDSDSEEGSCLSLPSCSSISLSSPWARVFVTCWKHRQRIIGCESLKKSGIYDHAVLHVVLSSLASFPRSQIYIFLTHPCTSTAKSFYEAIELLLALTSCMSLIPIPTSYTTRSSALQS